jgi:hypothetical protein
MKNKAKEQENTKKREVGKKTVRFEFQSFQQNQNHNGMRSFLLWKNILKYGMWSFFESLDIQRQIKAKH